MLLTTTLSLSFVHKPPAVRSSSDKLCLVNKRTRRFLKPPLLQKERGGVGIQTERGPHSLQIFDHCIIFCRQSFVVLLYMFEFSLINKTTRTESTSKKDIN